ISCALVHSGLACHRPAAKAATWALLKEVPLDEPGFTTCRQIVTPLPKAARSGLMRPSAVGPVELKLDLSSLLVTDPTASIPSASAGAVMVFQLPLPSFPALLTTNIPFWAASVAPCVIMAVFPSRSSLL